MTVEAVEVSNGLDFDDLSAITSAEQREFVERLDRFMIENGASGRSLVPHGEVINLCLDLRNLIQKHWMN